MICKTCKTENGYIRFETKEWVCRKCGTISPVIIKEKVTHPKEEETEPPEKEHIVDEKKEAAADLKKDDPLYMAKEDWWY